MPELVPTPAQQPEPEPSGTQDASPVWFLYVVRRVDGALYTGVTTDVERRLREHAGARRGARALRARGPLTLAYRVALGPRSLALRAEHRLKRLSRAAKERLIDDEPDADALIAFLGLPGHISAR